MRVDFYRRDAVAGSLALLLVLTGCTGGRDDAVRTDPVATGEPLPFADCAALTSPISDSTSVPAVPAVTSTPPTADSAPPASSLAAAGSAAADTGALPALELPCLNGGEAVAMNSLRGPAVINFWATWCSPCRAELPAFQDFADRGGGRVRVIGVNTKDKPATAADLGRELGLTFPNFDDPQERLLRGLGRAALPITVLLDSQGRVRHVYQGAPLDGPALGRLVRDHLGVAVPA